MKFSPAFYIINGWPSVEKTIEMVDKYVDHGVNAIQICMPSSNPYGESKFIQERMKHAIDQYGLNYDIFMDCIREIRKRHPKIEFHQVHPGGFPRRGPGGPHRTGKVRGLLSGSPDIYGYG